MTAGLATTRGVSWAVSFFLPLWHFLVIGKQSFLWLPFVCFSPLFLSPTPLFLNPKAAAQSRCRARRPEWPLVLPAGWPPGSATHPIHCFPLRSCYPPSIIIHVFSGAVFLLSEGPAPAPFTYDVFMRTATERWAREGIQKVHSYFVEASLATGALLALLLG